MITLRLPWPPSVNRYWRHVNGRVLVSREGRAYRDEVCLIARGCGADKGLAGDLSLEALLYPPDNRRRDIDNLGKALLDALQAAGVYGDDNQIAELRLARREVRKGGLVEVRIETIEPTGGLFGKHA